MLCAITIPLEKTVAYSNIDYLVINKGQKMTRDINPNALKMRKFDPYKKKFNDMQLIKIIGPHIRR